MRNFYLIANPSKVGTLETAREIADYMQAHGAKSTFTVQENQYADLIPEDTDCVITLGGDGTLIRAAKNLYTRNIPLLGINMGTLGYLTQVTRGEPLPPLLDALLEGNFRLENRMMLEGEVIGSTYGADNGSEQGIALNEVVISRNGGMQPIRFELHVNGNFLNAYTADGIIIATPTGSTAYNLSAGGPIVTPGAELMVVTPICSHALNSRSIVLAGNDVVEIYIKGPSGQSQMAVFDGDHAIPLDGTRRLRVCRSVYQMPMVRLKDVSFLENLRNKMTGV